MLTSFYTLKVVHLIFWNNTYYFSPFSAFFFLFFKIFLMTVLKNLLNLLQYCLFYVLIFVCKAYGILVLQPGIEPAPLAIEGKVLTTGPPGRYSPSSSLSLHVPLFSLKDWLSGFKYQFSYFQCDLGQRCASVSSSLEKGYHLHLEGLCGIKWLAHMRDLEQCVAYCKEGLLQMGIGSCRCWLNFESMKLNERALSIFFAWSLNLVHVKRFLGALIQCFRASFCRGTEQKRLWPGRIHQ